MTPPLTEIVKKQEGFEVVFRRKDNKEIVQPILVGERLLVVFDGDLTTTELIDESHHLTAEELKERAPGSANAYLSGKTISAKVDTYKRPENHQTRHTYPVDFYIIKED